MYKLALCKLRYKIILFTILHKKTDMKINTPKDLSAVIKDSRKLKGWTQADLAKRIGVYQRDISNCETKPEKVSVDMLIKLCAALELEFKIANLPKNEVSTPTNSLAKKSLRF